MASTQITLYAWDGVKNTYQGSIYDSSGNPVSLANLDKLRFKIYRGTTLVVDLVSGTGTTTGTPTTGGSSLTITNLGDVSTPCQYTLYLGSGDMVATPGPYDISVLQVKAADSSRDYPLQWGVAHILRTIPGSM